MKTGIKEDSLCGLIDWILGSNRPGLSEQMVLSAEKNHKNVHSFVFLSDSGNPNAYLLQITITENKYYNLKFFCLPGKITR
jgi:hypothetical protein